MVAHQRTRSTFPDQTEAQLIARLDRLLVELRDAIAPAPGDGHGYVEHRVYPGYCGTCGYPKAQHEKAVT